MDSEEREFIRQMPKVELHLHLEGSIHPETAIDFMKCNNASYIPQNSDGVQQLYRFGDLSEFVEAMRIVTNHVVQLEYLGRLTRELLQTLVAQNVRYVEFDCAIQKYMDLGFGLNDIISVIYENTAQIQSQLQIEAKLIVNLLRSYEPKMVASMVEKIARLEHPFIVAVGLSGDEKKFPQKYFKKAFDVALEAGLHRTVHAGEASGPDSVWDAIQRLHAERIDHGTTSIRDQKLVEYLAVNKIPLTQCLSSNLRLHVVHKIHAHPFIKFLRKGLVVSLNTDDPQVFDTTLTREYEIATESFDLSADDLSKIVLNGVESAFISTNNKEELKKKLTEELNHLKQQFGFDSPDSVLLPYL